MVLIIESRRAEINQSNLSIEQNLPLASRALYLSGRGGYIAIIGKCLVVVADQ